MAKVGRPTNYGPGMLQKAQQYIQECKAGHTIPFIEELALELDVNDDTIVEWSKEHEEFSATIRKLKTRQKIELMRGGLSKAMQPNMAIFLLKANHGLDEKVTESPGDQNITVRFVEPKTLDQVIAECEATRKNAANTGQKE
jgi:hypothetical protein